MQWKVLDPLTDGPEISTAVSTARKAVHYQRLVAVLRGLVVFILSLGLVKLGLYFSGYDLAITITPSDQGPLSSSSTHYDKKNKSNLDSGVCDIYESAVTTKAPKPNIWTPISAEDNAAVWAWLHDPAQGLNLTHPENAGINDNHVYWIDTVPLNKTDVLDFVDGDGPRPPSYARVILYEGGKLEPIAQEYMVGPLPVGPSTTIQPLDYLYNGGMGGSVPYDGRAVNAPRRVALDLILGPAMGNVADITRKLFSGAAYFGVFDKRTTVIANFGTPVSFDGSKAHINAVFNFPGQAMYLLPIDFYVLIDWTGTDTKLWSVKGYVTKERFFPTEEELRKAFEAGELEPEDHQRRDYDWALVKYQPSLGERPLEHRAAPQSKEIGGKRYKVDPDAQYVEYMGWSFYITTSRSLGLMFYDIRFRGERILYELSMQEAASQYGGFQPKAASTVFHDASFSLSSSMFPLVEGFDCPWGSTFWNVSFHEGNTTMVHPHSICLFEQDPGHPLSRHRAADWASEESGQPGSFGFDSLGIVKNAQLNVRFIATVGNYDYIFNYAFGLDGSLDVSVRASGYLMSSYYYQDGGGFGPRIQRATQGSIHDHVITFKADFDIVNATNRMTRTVLDAVPQSQPWFPELGVFEQLQMKTETVSTEQQGNWAPNHNVMYTVEHVDATNAWGSPRGYRIVPGLSNIHLTTQKSPFSRDNMAFAKSHWSITRQHDTEPWANSVHNANLPWNPQQDFAKFLDSESIDAEDIVFWFNLGMHHFTRAEDVPVTLFTEAVSSITFAPQNFFDRAQDGDLKNRRWIVPSSQDGDHLVEEDYGFSQPQCVDEWDLDNMLTKP